MPAPWMARQDAADCHAATFERAVFFNSFEAVGATGGCEPTLSAEEGGYSPLVKADNADE